MNQDESLKLSNQLCFSIYACSKEIIKLYKPYLDELGLTYTQYITMLVLWEENNISVKNLGERLFLDSGTLTPLLKKLEKMGIISRNRSESDERVMIVSLTDDGKKLKEKAKEVPYKVFCASKLSIEEGTKLKSDINHLLDKLTKE